MNTVQTVAKELADAFMSDKRDDGGVFYKIKDDAPDWIKSRDADCSSLSMRFHKAVDDRMPDDWFYESASRLADCLAEYDSIDAMREASTETADGDVDVYNSDLTKWLASHNFNLSLCDEAAEEFGEPEGNDMIKRIMQGQFLALDRICNALISEIENESESREQELEGSEP